MLSRRVGLTASFTMEPTSELLCESLGLFMEACLMEVANGLFDMTNAFVAVFMLPMLFATSNFQFFCAGPLAIRPFNGLL